MSIRLFAIPALFFLCALFFTACSTSQKTTNDANTAASAQLNDDDISSQNRLDKKVIEDAVNLHKDEIAQCIKAERKHNPDLAGYVMLGWSVNETGSVENIFVKESTINSQGFETCVESSLKSWTFPETSSGTLEADYVFSTKNKSDVAKALKTSSKQKSPTSIEITRIFRENKPNFDACMDPLSSDKVLLKVSFIITPKGNLENPEVIENSSNDPRISDCIKNTLLTLTFPAPEDGEPVTVNRFPIVIQSR